MKIFIKLYNLKSLNFSHNLLETIHSNQLLYAKNLTSIDFSYNLIEVIENETFSISKSLII